jgi:hypothetical protein
VVPALLTQSIVRPAALWLPPNKEPRLEPAAPLPGPGSVKKTLAKHCHKAASKRSEEVETRGVVKGRLKDKLLVLKAKMAKESSSNLANNQGREPVPDHDC